MKWVMVMCARARFVFKPSVKIEKKREDARLGTACGGGDRRYRQRRYACINTPLPTRSKIDETSAGVGASDSVKRRKGGKKDGIRYR